MAIALARVRRILASLTLGNGELFRRSDPRREEDGAEEHCARASERKATREFRQTSRLYVEECTAAGLIINFKVHCTYLK